MASLQNQSYYLTTNALDKVISTMTDNKIQSWGVFVNGLTEHKPLIKAGLSLRASQIAQTIRIDQDAVFINENKKDRDTLPENLPEKLTNFPYGIQNLYDDPHLKF